MIRFALPPRRRPAPPPAAATSVEGDEPTSGCGWFDSSHELSAGLLVQEHRAGDGDAALAALPLATWLDLQLTGWNHPAVAAPSAC